MVTWLSTESKTQDGSTLQTRQKLTEPSTHTHKHIHLCFSHLASQDWAGWCGGG